MVNFCCEDMKCHIYETNDSERKTILYVPKFNEYGIPCREDSISMILIHYCPWCGCELPDSLRNKWFDDLLALGFEEPLFDERIPQEYKTDLWWNRAIRGRTSDCD